jgi:hypothetical protein
MVHVIGIASGDIKAVFAQHTAGRSAAAIMAINVNPVIGCRRYVEGVSFASRAFGTKPSALLLNNTAKKRNKSAKLSSLCFYFFWDIVYWLLTYNIVLGYIRHTTGPSVVVT